MNINKSLFVCFVIFSYVSYVSAQEGNACFNQDRSKEGKCVSVEDCPTAKKILKQGQRPQNCGYNGIIPLVCCIDENSNVVGDRKSKQKCKQYESEIKQMLKGKCSRTRYYIVIGGGVKAEEMEFPHMVAIGYSPDNTSTTYICGGTLISKTFVLTAAHCMFSSTYGSPKIIIIGDLVLNSEKDIAQPQVIKVAKIHYHPDYKRRTKYNDIALLELEEEVKFSPFAYPACLPTDENVDDYSEVIATGWGNTNAWGDPSDTLMKVEINIIPQNNCSEFYNKLQRGLGIGLSEKTQLCAASLVDRKDTCRGDSGGPLQIKSIHFCMYDVLGLTSFGKPCLLSNAPGVYTKVFPYLDWIEEIVWP